MKAKYDYIGDGYNTTRKADPYLLEQLHYHLNPIKKGLYLDIGCGTGNYTAALHQKGISFVGVDPSYKMLTKAKEKYPAITWTQGNVEAIPLANNSIEGIIGSLTLHHWDDLTKGFEELHRVLKNYGSIVFFTATPDQMQGYWLNHYFPKMMEDSMTQMPSLLAVENAMKHAGFMNIYTEKYSIQPGLKDLFLYAGKHNPKLYLNPQVRNGISSFSDLAYQDEVNEGLAQLSQDIASGEIERIMKHYENNSGDYLFILNQKED